MFKQYIDYLKDNPQGYWFKRKLYGWGWVPVKWQGWLVLLVFVVVLVWDTIRLNSSQHSVSDFLINLVPQAFILFVILIAICYLTGERPKWQWGKPKQDN